MKKLALLALALALVAPATADAARVGGSFSIGTLAGWDDKSKYITGSNVWCTWSGGHVKVHVTLRNRSVETIEATVKPRYYIARGSEHGSSFTAGVDIRISGGGRRSVLIDAGAPKNTPRGARIGRCAPYLYLVD